MLLKIDPKAPESLALINDIPGDAHTDHRRYYIPTDDRQAILVLRPGLDLADIANQVVDAAIGSDVAVSQFACPEDVGQRRTKVSIFRLVYQNQARGPQGRYRFLSTLLNQAPRRR